LFIVSVMGALTSFFCCVCWAFPEWLKTCYCVFYL
jgi:hypothetical protein